MSLKVKERLRKKQERKRVEQESALDEACKKAGATLDQIISCIDNCRCCFTGLPETANEHLCYMVYWDWRWRQ